jgi:deoxyribodipyrimidine photolyase-related protein
MKTLLLLPNQLFSNKYISNLDITHIILWEHPDYFTKYNFNKKKLILHRASMKYYQQYLTNKKYKVQYINFNQQFTFKTNMCMFDPINKMKLPKHIDILESPNFLLTSNDYKLYRNKTKSFKFNNFYLWSKQQLDIYPQLKSLDKYNRETFKNKQQIPQLKQIHSANDKKLITEATTYVNKHFSKNLGNTNNFIYPITHKSTLVWFNNFLTKKLNNFGPYQDFVKQDENFMFHSVLSASINIGLLNPREIIEKLHKVYKKVRENSFEGYLRQLFWREYQRYTYTYIDFSKHNYFNLNKKLTKQWYNGTLGIKPIDDLIVSGIDTGYIHHIGRLMYIGNYMVLSGISPKQGFKWFMEFSCDSYEWVMYQNVLDMVFFVTGGMTTRKPYISSSNYLVKNSDYSCDNWCSVWDQKYKMFLKNNKQKLWKFRYHFPTLNK